MKKTIPVSQISIVHGITSGEASKVSVQAILTGEGAPVTPSVKPYNDHYALVFGINHLYAAKERGDKEMEVEVTI